MARKKVTLQWIANDSTRRATFKKRRAGLMKKARELATLCDVDACVVVYGEGAPLPEVWPPSPAEAARVVARFRDMPELDQCKKMMGMEDFLRQRVAKLEEQLRRARRENRDRETVLLLHDAIAGRRPGLEGLSIEELTSLGSVVEARLRGVTDRIGSLHGQGQGAPAALQLSLASLAPPVPYAAGAGHEEVQAPNPQGWLADLAGAGGALARSSTVASMVETGAPEEASLGARMTCSNLEQTNSVRSSRYCVCNCGNGSLLLPL